MCHLDEQGWVYSFCRYVILKYHLRNSSCRVNKPITEFIGFKTCNKCRAKKRERTANNGYICIAMFVKEE